SPLFDEAQDLAVSSADRPPEGRDLPGVRLDPRDPVTAVVLPALALVDGDRRRAQLQQAVASQPDSTELHLRLANELTWLGSFEAAENQLKMAAKLDPFDWRPSWYRGRMLLAEGRGKDAVTAFEAV